MNLTPIKDNITPTPNIDISFRYAQIPSLDSAEQAVME